MEAPTLISLGDSRPVTNPVAADQLWLLASLNEAKSCIAWLKSRSDIDMSSLGELISRLVDSPQWRRHFRPSRWIPPLTWISAVPREGVLERLCFEEASVSWKKSQVQQLISGQMVTGDDSRDYVIDRAERFVHFLVEHLSICDSLVDD